MSGFSTPVMSDIYALQVEGPTFDNSRPDLQFAYFSYQHGADNAGSGVVPLLILPAGPIQLFFDRSRIQASQAESDTTLSLGFAAYTDQNRESVDADPNCFLDAADVTSGAVDEPCTAPSGESEKRFLNSESGIVLQATYADDGIVEGDTIHGWVAYRLNRR